MNEKSKLKFKILRIIKKRRKSPDKKRALEGRGIPPQPQYSGSVTSVFTLKPKKPNSAQRKALRLTLKISRIKSMFQSATPKGPKNIKKSAGATVIVYIPGEKHQIQPGAKLMAEGGRRRDLIGVNYKVIRKGDCAQKDRKNARSRYGTKKPEVSKGAAAA